MSIRADLSPTDVIVAPGDEELMTVHVANQSDMTRTVSLVPSGLAQGWSIIEKPSVTLLPGGEDLIGIRLKPPRVASVTSGTSTFTLRVVPMDDPSDVASIDGSVTVLAFDDRRIEVAQPVLRSRRRAMYDVLVDNDGNIRASCRLMYVDNTGRTVGRFDPPSVGIEPGMSAAVKLRVKAKRRRWRSEARALPFAVHAVQDDHRTVVGSASLLQDPMISGRFVGRLAMLAAACAAAIGGWAWVVKPSIEDAARDAVRDQGLAPVDSVDPAASSLVPTASTIVDPTDPVVNVQEGLEIGISETLLAPADKFADKTIYTVPTGKRFLLTDLHLQNPSGDVGRFTVTAGTDVIYNPDPSSGDVKRQQFFTPWPMEAGEKLVASFEDCTPGDTTQGQCSVIAVALGRLVDAVVEEG